MQICEYFFENACYSVTKYYLCKQNNKRSLLGRKQRSQVVRSFPNRYLFSFTNKVTSLFPISCILEIILTCKRSPYRSATMFVFFTRRTFFNAPYNKMSDKKNSSCVQETSSLSNKLNRKPFIGAPPEPVATCVQSGDIVAGTTNTVA